MNSSLSTISIRLLSEDDWQEARAIRLRALTTDPGVFGRTLEEALKMTDEHWQKWVSSPGKRMFGLYDETNTMIGLTGVAADREDSTTALLISSYIMPEYRGRGLSRLLYETRLNWAKSQPQFKHVKVSHRDGNEASRRANQAFGFKEVERKPHKWPDGTEAPEIFYLLKIR